MKSRHLLGGQFQEVFSAALWRMQQTDEAKKPCIVVRDAVTDRFFQCSGGLAAKGTRKLGIRMEVPRCWEGGNRAVDVTDLGIFFHVLLGRDDAEVENTFAYELEECRIFGATIRDVPYAAKLGVRIAEELLRLRPSTLLEIDEFCAEPGPEPFDPKARIVSGVLGS